MEHLPVVQTRLGPNLCKGANFSLGSVPCEIPAGFSLGARNDVQRGIDDVATRKTVARLPSRIFDSASNSYSKRTNHCLKGCTPVVLCLFAGRRRHMDLQDAIEKMFTAANRPVTVISYDLVYGHERDLLNPSTIRFFAKCN